MTNPLTHATALYHAGRYAEAEAEARAIAEAPRTGPEDMVFGLLALEIVALAASAQGRHTEALGILDEVRPPFEELIGPEHMLALKLRADRAQVLTTLDRYAEAESECAAVAHLAERQIEAGAEPEMQLLRLNARSGQLHALTALGLHPEAEAVARQAIASHHEDDQISLILRLGLCRSLNLQERHEDALAEARLADELRSGWDEERRRPETGAVELAAARALLGLGHEAAARPLVATALDACLTAFGPDNSRTVEARELLERIDGA
ncbi:tetratricopeptide repeat protein [Kitasatospora sp. NPDC051853]|uniref:tetratricopeptide repeat protein n=1 Tax=Kitasatospora sp. NPDC051853 TaxID=3364058 RepID=UPI0037983449